MKRVNAWTTSDGQIESTPERALAHDLMLRYSTPVGGKMSFFIAMMIVKDRENLRNIFDEIDKEKERE